MPRSSIPKVAGGYTILSNIGDGNNATVRACVRNSDILNSELGDQRQQRNSHEARGERESGSYDTDGLSSPLAVRGEGESDGFGDGLAGNGGVGAENGLMVASNADKLAAKIIKKASVTNVSLGPGPTAKPTKPAKPTLTLTPAAPAASAAPATPAMRPTYPMLASRARALSSTLARPSPLPHGARGHRSTRSSPSARSS